MSDGAETTYDHCCSVRGQESRRWLEQTHLVGGNDVETVRETKLVTEAEHCC